MGVHEVWDIEVENDHSYLAHGFINHNSSSQPNLQNIPARDPELGPLMRSLFIPEDERQWVKFDYAQIEPRLLLHYAPASADAVRAAYAQDRRLDCYMAMLAGMPSGLERTAFKSIYLGLTYGMGVPKLAKQLGVSEAEVMQYFELFHNGAPYVRELRDRAMKRVNQRGYIITLLRRRAHFDRWEDARWRPEKEKEAICKQKGDALWFEPLTDRTAAVEKWGSAKRAWLHQVLNRLIQGGAADIMKKAMVDLWEGGVCDEIGAPMLTVHDELDFSLPFGAIGDEIAGEIQHTMENCVSLKVPLLCDVEFGDSWGTVKEKTPAS